jgi:hypothetical protein
MYHVISSSSIVYKEIPPSVWGNLRGQFLLSSGWVKYVAKFCLDWNFQIVLGR